MEVAQKSAQDAKKQVNKLEQALEHEKQLKTEVIPTRLFYCRYRHYYISIPGL